MTAKIKVCLLALLFQTLEGNAQQTVVDSLKRELATVRDDSMRWYYNLQLSASFLRINFDSARSYGERSLALGQNLGQGLCKALSLNTLGAIYWNKGDHETGLKYYFESLKISQSNGISKLASTTLGNIGLVYSDRKDYARALEYQRKSLALKISLRDTLGMTRVLNNIGEVFTATDQPDSALAYFMRCLPFFEAYPSQVYGQGIVLNNIGLIYLNKNDYAKARDYLNQSLRIRERIGDPGGLSVVLGNLGELALAEGNAAQAIAYYERSLALSQETGSESDLAEVWSKLSQAHAAQKNFPEAYEYLQKYTAWQDTLHRREREKSIAEMEVKYQTGLKEAEIIQKELQIERQRSRQRMILFTALAVVLALLGLFQYFRNRQRLRQEEARHALALQEAEAGQLRELDRAKSVFFANISHEFRTPLTLILGPLQKWLGAEGQKAKGKGQTGNGHATASAVQPPDENDQIAVPAKDLRNIRRNAARLLELINQLLDLSKLESGRMRLTVGRDDVVQRLRVLGNAFESMAEQGQIFYRIDIPQESVLGWFDRDKLEKITANLLANAFKHTPAGGTVTFRANAHNDHLHLSVEDTGQGIPAEELEKIFERFYQATAPPSPPRRGEAWTTHAPEGGETKPSSPSLEARAHQAPLLMGGLGGAGTGIGLALVKEFVSLHRGQLDVESTVGKGSIFRVSLPLGRSAFAAEEIADVPQTAISENVIFTKIAAGDAGPEEVVSATVKTENQELPLCLVVEDNRELQTFIRDQLDGHYRILLAVNGREGLEKAIEVIPDLIISDVMMPEMDGNALCAALKTDERTSHVPVILLTARAGQESKIEGLETGADDYLTKPFDTRELLIRAHNLVSQRERLRRQFSRTVVLKPQEIALTSADERFLQRIQETLDARLGDEQFSVEELAAAAGMSRSQLHRKLSALIDQPPVEFIRNFRLRRAKEMLEAGTGNVSEICYEVGFASPAYFSKAFKEAFGMSPSEVNK